MSRRCKVKEFKYNTFFSLHFSLGQNRGQNEGQNQVKIGLGAFHLAFHLAFHRRKISPNFSENLLFLKYFFFFKLFH
jgi:hypothetical protein